MYQPMHDLKDKKDDGKVKDETMSKSELQKSDVTERNSYVTYVGFFSNLLINLKERIPCACNKKILADKEGRYLMASY